ncbi:MAG: topoisomerase [Myxococcaceae bacterium]|nr:topoisomerase [Myxococcaceae bacterium]
MAKSLVIVESPAKAKTIQKYLGKDYEVMASKGHIKDLPKRGGVDLENDFQETYEVIEEKGKGDIVKSIRDKAKKVDHVLLAMDPDREGEAIASHIYQEVKDTETKADIRRVLFNEITKKGVYYGLDHPRDIDEHLYEAQRTRRVLDRIGGYPLSNLLWRKLAFGLSAGRVQTPALRLIVDRQKEIDAFVPVPYWVVDVALKGKAERTFTALLDSVNGTKLEKVSSRAAATSELEAQRYVNDLKRATYRISAITKRQSRRKAPAPYTTSKLQQDASTRLGMQPKRAMRVAQGLYEGVQIGKGKEGELVGLITYMRTDSVRVGDDAITEARTFIETAYGKSFLPDVPNVFKTKNQANVQDAHEAIRPTRMDLPPDVAGEYLKDEQLRLYKLIWDRFVASQMTPAVYDQTSVDIEGKVDDRAYGLRVSGSILREPGWRKVYGAGDAQLAGEEDAPSDEDKTLPPMDDGEQLALVDPPGVVSTYKQTEPPPYFNEASLVKKLEEEGIGRPSTYAEILSKVLARDYVVKVENKLVASDLGKLVIEKLVDDKFDLADISFTRKLEEDLDAIAENKMTRLAVLRPFHDRLTKQIELALENKGKWWPEPEPLEEPCPDCGKILVKRWGKNGPFIGCTDYPDCKYTRDLGISGEEADSRKPVLTDYTCNECGSKMMKRWGRNGWFLGCSTYPKCKGTRPMPLGIKCPKCATGDIIEIKSKGRGRVFYGCSNYNVESIKCDFRVWQKPVEIPCPDCGAKFVVRAGKSDEPGTLKCITEGCNFTREETQEEFGGEALQAVVPLKLDSTGTEDDD